MLYKEVGQTTGIAEDISEPICLNYIVRSFFMR